LHGAAACRSCVCEDKKPTAAAAARIGAALARRKRLELLELLRPCFARTELWLQAGKHAAALMSQIPRRNGWTIAAQAREWIPVEHLGDPVKPAVMGLPADLVFRTKGQLAIDILTEALADGVQLDFVCGDEVYGSCTQLCEYCEDRSQAYVLRVPSSFRLMLPGGVTLTCKQAAARLGRGRGGRAAGEAHGRGVRRLGGQPRPVADLERVGGDQAVSGIASVEDFRLPHPGR
jgi:hypothetical protein